MEEKRRKEERKENLSIFFLEGKQHSGKEEDGSKDMGVRRREKKRLLREKRERRGNTNINLCSFKEIASHKLE